MTQELIHLAWHSALGKAGQVSCAQEWGSHPELHSCSCSLELSDVPSAFGPCLYRGPTVWDTEIFTDARRLCVEAPRHQCGHSRLVAPVIFVTVWSCWRVLLSWSKAICFFFWSLEFDVWCSKCLLRCFPNRAIELVVCVCYLSFPPPKSRDLLLQFLFCHNLLVAKFPLVPRTQVNAPFGEVIFILLWIFIEP